MRWAVLLQMSRRNVFLRTVWSIRICIIKLLMTERTIAPGEIKPFEIFQMRTPPVQIASV
jgi:hypothetical protein